MGWNGSGGFSFTYSWTNDAANGVPITASRMDTQFSDAVTGFQNCLTRDNQGKASASFLPGSDAAYDLGGSSAHWRALYLSSGWVGTTTNDSAASGYVGEYLESVVTNGSAVPLTTGTPLGIASVTLTAGDWDVIGSVTTVPNGATLTQAIVGGLSTVANTLPALELRQYQTPAQTAGFNGSVAISRQRYSVASSTTVSLVVLATFTTNTLSACGFVNARRVR